MREEQRLTEEQLAERSQVPVEFVRNLETAQDLNPDSYYLIASLMVWAFLSRNSGNGWRTFCLFPKMNYPGMMMRTTVGRKNCERRNE